MVPIYENGQLTERWENFIMLRIKLTLQSYIGVCNEQPYF